MTDFVSCEWPIAIDYKAKEGKVIANEIFMSLPLATSSFMLLNVKPIFCTLWKSHTSQSSGND